MVIATDGIADLSGAIAIGLRFRVAFDRVFGEVVPFVLVKPLSRLIQHRDQLSVRVLECRRRRAGGR